MKGLDYSIRAKLGLKSTTGKTYNQKQYQINCRVKEALDKQFEGQTVEKIIGNSKIYVSKSSEVYNKMTQEEKNNYYNSLN